MLAAAAMAALPPIISGIGSFIGAERANKQRREESQRNRVFQERMRNTQWQASIADMRAAGINPAVAYSKGPNAAPGGSMAQQMDSISPAISSAMQMRRMSADLGLLKQQTAKARGEAASAGAKGELDQFRTRWMKTIMNAEDPNSVMPILRMLEGEVGGVEQRTRKDRLTGDIMGPMAGLSERMGEFLPILMMLSTMSPGGLLKGAGRKITARRAVGRLNRKMGR